MLGCEPSMHRLQVKYFNSFLELTYDASNPDVDLPFGPIGNSKGKGVCLFNDLFKSTSIPSGWFGCFYFLTFMSCMFVLIAVDFGQICSFSEADEWRLELCCLPRKGSNVVTCRVT